MNRFPLIVLAIVLTGMLGVAEPLAAAAPQAAGKKGKTQRRTFVSSDYISVPDNGAATPYPSTIKVKGFKKGKTTDVKLTLHGLAHGNPDDVDVLLAAPNGRTAIVMSDVGGSNSTPIYVTLTLDDGAAAPLPDSDPLTSGAFRPTNHGVGIDPFPGGPAPSGAVALSTFKGSKPNGAWRLFAVDDAGGGAGWIAGGWDLKITAKVKNKKHEKH